MGNQWPVGSHFTILGKCTSWSWSRSCRGMYSSKPAERIINEMLHPGLHYHGNTVGLVQTARFDLADVGTFSVALPRSQSISACSSCFFPKGSLSKDVLYPGRMVHGLFFGRSNCPRLAFGPIIRYLPLSPRFITRRLAIREWGRVLTLVLDGWGQQQTMASTLFGRVYEIT